MDGPLMKTASSILQRAVKLDNEKRFTESLVCYQEGIQVLMALSKAVQNEERIKLRPKIEGRRIRVSLNAYNQPSSFCLTRLHEKSWESQDAHWGFEGERELQGTVPSNWGCEGVFIQICHVQILGWGCDQHWSWWSLHTISTSGLFDEMPKDPTTYSVALFLNLQCDNFVRFLELCLSRCHKLKTIKLITGKDNDKAFEEQFRRLKTIQNSLATVPGKLVELNIEFSDSLHDREIR